MQLRWATVKHCAKETLNWKVPLSSTVYYLFPTKLLKSHRMLWKARLFFQFHITLRVRDICRKLDVISAKGRLKWRGTVELCSVEKSKQRQAKWRVNGDRKKESPTSSSYHSQKARRQVDICSKIHWHSTAHTHSRSRANGLILFCSHSRRALASTIFHSPRAARPRAIHIWTMRAPVCYITWLHARILLSSCPGAISLPPSLLRPRWKKLGHARECVIDARGPKWNYIFEPAPVPLLGRIAIPGHAPRTYIYTPTHAEEKELLCHRPPPLLSSLAERTVRESVNVDQSKECSHACIALAEFLTSWILYATCLPSRCFVFFFHSLRWVGEKQSRLLASNSMTNF